MSCKSPVSKIAAEFSLTGNSISRRIFAPTLSCSQLGLILRAGLTLKSSSKITPLLVEHFKCIKLLAIYFSHATTNANVKPDSSSKP